MDLPEANSGPAPTPDGFTVEHRYCDCCKPKEGKPDPKCRRRFFVRDAAGTVVCMSHDWKTLCKARGWS